MTEPTNATTANQEPRRIAVIGASRGVGRAVVAAAVARGFAVNALARTAPQPAEQADAECGQVADVFGEAVRWVRGSATDPGAVTAALNGTDAVILTLGAPARDTTGLRTQGTRVVLEAMREQGMRRLVVNSSLGVGDSARLLSAPVRYLLAPLFMKRALDDHADQEGLVTASDLDWTILRPGGLTGECGGAQVAAGFTETSDVTLRIPRADVASYALDHLDDETTFHRAIALGTVKR